jgi:hypothetical protein
MPTTTVQENADSICLACNAPAAKNMPAVAVAEEQQALCAAAAAACSYITTAPGSAAAHNTATGHKSAAAWRMLSKHTHHFWQVLDVHAAHAVTAAAAICCRRHCTRRNRQTATQQANCQANVPS